MRSPRWFAPTALLSLVAACSTAEKPPGKAAASTSARLTTPTSPADVASVSKAEVQFGLDLYRAIASDQRKNVLVSPHSVSLALAMTYAGSAGTTRGAFERALHVELPEEHFHRATNDLDRQLAARGRGARGANGGPFRLVTVNQLFARSGLAIEVPFLDLLAECYGADVRLLDFARAPERSREMINRWVEVRTARRIHDLVPSSSIDPMTAAVLVNAIYFTAGWATAFEPTATRDGDFHLLDGTTARTPMMSHGHLHARAAWVRGVDVVELPYDGRQLSMLLLMPPASDFATIERRLTPERLDEYVAALTPGELSLTMPRFEMRTSASLKQVLEGLGLTTAFRETADFSRISKQEPNGDLFLSDVLHQAFVDVRETGTEAAAATGVVMRFKGGGRRVTLDHPFIFLIRDDATRAVLFLGRYLRPD
jgi:serpin B